MEILKLLQPAGAAMVAQCLILACMYEEAQDLTSIEKTSSLTSLYGQCIKVEVNDGNYAKQNTTI